MNPRPAMVTHCVATDLLLAQQIESNREAEENPRGNAQ